MKRGNSLGAPSFRDGPKDQTRNLEIPGSMLSHRPGMTAKEKSGARGSGGTGGSRARSERGSGGSLLFSTDVNAVTSGVE